MNRQDNDTTASCHEKCTQVLSDVKHLVYNRVPKCGSRTTRHLFANLSGKNNFVVNYAFGGEKYFNGNTEAQVNVSRILQSTESSIYIKHMHFINFLTLGLSKTFLYVNLIRDPLDRFQSAFYFYGRSHKSERIRLPRQPSNTTLNKCVETNHKKCTQPEHIFRIVPFFCGYDPRCRIPSQWTLNQALKNVETYFPVVGYLENYNQFLELLEYVWPQFFHGARNTYTNMMRGSTLFYKHPTVKTEKLSPENTEIMKGRMGLEYDFYHFIKQRFHCMFKNICNKLGKT